MQIVGLLLLLLVGYVACEAPIVSVGQDKHGLIEPNGVAYSGPHYVLEDATFNITCHLSNGLPLKWTKDGVEIDINDKRYTFGYSVPLSGSPRQSSLIVAKAQRGDGGRYKCYSFSSSRSLYHDVTVIHDIVTNEKTKGRGFIMVYGTDIDLQCSVSEDEHVNMTWFKNDKKVDLSTGKFSMGKGNNTLTVHSAQYDNAGKYTCAIDGDVTRNASIELKANATASKLDKSINLVQGDKLRLQCKAYGYPIPIVTWLKDNVPVRGSNSTKHIKLMPDEGNITDAILIIEHLEESDRAEYTCRVSNEVNSMDRTIMVRVKDKLAALWPFLGILAEVAILCTIIFIYEKRRAKQEYDESDTDQNNESKPVGDQKDKDVRQRK